MSGLRTNGQAVGMFYVRGDPRWCQLAQEPWTSAQQYHYVSAAALQPGAQSSGADLALSAHTGSPTRYFVAWRTSWTPARWRGTGSPPTTAWSARSARSPGFRLRPLYRC